MAKKIDSGLIIEANFKYEAAKKRLTTRRKVFLDRGQHTWFNLTLPKEGVLLLARMITRDETKVSMEYLIIDTDRADAILSTEAINTPLNEPTTITIDRSGEKISLSILMKPRLL